MALTINTNVSSLIAQRSLNNATEALNKSIERMSTGYKINHSADNAAGYSIARIWTTQLGSLDVAADNAATGADMVSTAEDSLALVSAHIQRVRDLTEQAANGTYGTASLNAIKAEIVARLDEIDRISGGTEFNGKMLLDGSITANVKLQVGLYADGTKNTISINKDYFKSTACATLFKDFGDTSWTTVEAIAKACTGINTDGTLDTSVVPANALNKLDKVMKEVSNRTTNLGAIQNRITSAVESIGVQSQSITSALSTLRDTDVAQESSNYIQAQILQQASATLLATANQAPSIAINLI
jgi:flagellin